MKKSDSNKMVTSAPNKKSGAKPPTKRKSKKGDAPVEVLSEDDKKEVAIINQKKSKEKTGMAAFEKMTRQQIDLIKRTVAKDATDDELKLFISVCHGSQLNPFLRQVHFVKRWSGKDGKSVGTIQVGIDGFRAIAEGGGQYAGSDDAVHRDDFEITVNKEKITVPGSATVTVHKLMDGERYPFTATARWREYYTGEKQGYMWHKMPYGQLAKCAEGLALRKAFPKLLSGLYVPEEMDQAGTVQAPPTDSKFDRAISMIGKINDPQTLEQLKLKVSEAKKESYDAKEKKSLLSAIGVQLKKLGEVADKKAEADGNV